MGLTCYKWKANTTKLKGIGDADDPNEADDPDEGVSEVDDLNEADDPDEGIGEADDPDKGVGEANDPNEGVDEADDPNKADNPDEGVGEADDLDKGVGIADDPDVALLGLHVCIYIEISYAPRLVLIKRLLQGKDSEKYAHKDSYKEKNSTPRKRGQPFTTIKSPNTLTNQGTHNLPLFSTLEL